MYVRPATIEEALDRLASGAVIIAGGTDFYPARVGKRISESVVDITAIAALRGISDRGDHLRIGAAARWSELQHQSVPSWMRCLALAGREVGGVQIQNTGTIVGNLCNASPAADGTPCLLALSAVVELHAHAGTRTLPVGEFVRGNRRTALAPGEMVAALLVPKPAKGARSTFLKLGARKYLVISIAMVAALVEVDDTGTIERASIAVGACSVVAQRLQALEQDLRGRKLTAGIGDVVEPSHVSALTPIDDVRGTAAYRSDAARTVVARALESLAA